MPKNRVCVKHRRKSSSTSPKWLMKAAITSNPFLNYFLSRCRVKGNAKLHKFAKKTGEEWKEMSYHEKTPYYILADTVNPANSSKRTIKKRRFSETDIGEDSFSMITVIKKADSTKRNLYKHIVDKIMDNKEENDETKDESVEKQNIEGSEEISPVVTNSISGQNSNNDNESLSTKHVHYLKPYNGKPAPSSVSGSSVFHSLDSEDSVEKCSIRSRAVKSWTDSFDYMT